MIWTTFYSHPSLAQPRRLRRMCLQRRNHSRRRRPRHRRPRRHPSCRHPSRRHLSSLCRQLPALRLKHPRPLTHRQRCRVLSPPLQIHRRHLHRLQRLQPRLSHLLLCLRLHLRTPASTHTRHPSSQQLPIYRLHHLCLHTCHHVLLKTYAVTVFAIAMM
jgi:hypothetical protein